MTYELDEVKILVVDDMIPMLTLTKSVLQAMGFRQVHGARDGDEGYNVYCEERPDIIITDWQMEPINGLEMINKIRNDPESPNPFVPIIVMTGYSDRLHVEMARDSGMTEFLSKPYKARDMYSKIHRLIEKPRQFVKAKDFFGPDRRRKEDDYEGPVRRKQDYLEALEKEAVAQAATEDDIIMRNKNSKDSKKDKK